MSKSEEGCGVNPQCNPSSLISVLTSDDVCILCGKVHFSHKGKLLNQPGSYDIHPHKIVIKNELVKPISATRANKQVDVNVVSDIETIQNSIQRRSCTEESKSKRIDSEPSTDNKISKVSSSDEDTHEGTECRTLAQENTQRIEDKLHEIEGNESCERTIHHTLIVQIGSSGNSDCKSKSKPSDQGMGLRESTAPNTTQKAIECTDIKILTRDTLSSAGSRSTLSGSRIDAKKMHQVKNLQGLSTRSERNFAHFNNSNKCKDNKSVLLASKISSNKCKGSGIKARNVCTEILPIKTDQLGRKYIDFQEASTLTNEMETKQQQRRELLHGKVFEKRNCGLTLLPHKCATE